MSDDFKEKYNSHNVTITGWLFGSYKTYMYTIPVEVKDEGEFEEEIPDGAIFYSTFDKELSSRSLSTRVRDGRTSTSSRAGSTTRVRA